jgi:hypothetical protein
MHPLKTSRSIMVRNAGLFTHNSRRASMVFDVDQKIMKNPCLARSNRCS